jgi:glycosyltransferase involved in cell wall biosynthesis
MIPTFNPKEKYLKIAVNSVISQGIDSDKMQIEVVDDCSDKVDVEKIVNENWNGRVKYYRQPVNIGHSFNFTECIRRSKGELIHLLHDDDLVKPGFYKAFENIFNKYENAGAVFCRQEYIDEEGNLNFYSELEMPEQGILENALIKLAQKQRIQYCAIAFRRKIFEKIGGFITKNISCEDWEMWVRIAKNFPVAYEPESLACYRVHHGTSMTLKDMRTGQDMRYMRESIKIFNEYLPKEKREEVGLFRRKYYGVYSFKNAKRLLEEFNDKEGAAAQISETIKIDPELIFDNLKFLKELETPVYGAGVSVIVCTENSEKTIERTLRHLIIQRVPDYIPWEIIISDNGSSDATLNIVSETWQKYKNKIPIRIIHSCDTGFFESREKAVSEAKYNYLIFCYPGDFLKRDYVHMVSVNMLKDLNLGVLGSYTEEVIKSNKPDWYSEKNKHFYQIGEQGEFTKAITWTKGHVWSSGMSVKKDALESLSEKNFKSAFHGLKGKAARISIDKELCYALRLSGYSIWYSIDLRLNHLLEESDLSWNNLRKIYRQEGINSVLLYKYQKTKKISLDDFGKFQVTHNNRKLIRNTYRKLKKFKRQKLYSFNESSRGDRDKLLIEYEFAALTELLNEIKPYNKKIRILRKIFNKRDFRYLKFVVKNPYFRFPEYRKKNDSRGATIILNYSGYDENILYRSLENIINQKLHKGFPWEVILFMSSARNNLINDIYRKWERSNCSGTLKIINNFTGNNESLRSAAAEKSRYDCLIFLSSNDFINPDYVRIAYKALHINKQAGIIGGQTEAAKSVKPPQWFKEYKNLFGIGKPFDKSGDVTDSREYLWSSGLVVRRQAVTDAENLKYKLDFQRNNNVESELINDKSFSNKIKLAGWKVVYEDRLKLMKYISVRKFSWEYLRKLHNSIGAEEVRDIVYEKLYNSISAGQDSGSWIYKAANTLKELKGYSLNKILSSDDEYRNDKEVLQIEKLEGRFKELIKSKDYYTKFGDKLINNLNGSGFKKTHKSDNVSNLKDEKLKGVSIVICCYNSSLILPVALEHIFRQRVPDHIPWEIIVVDNGSTDNTAEVANRIYNDSDLLVPFKVVKESKPGLSNARLKGYNTAKYEYIILCDDDNLLHRDFVKKAFDIMSGNEMIGVLGGQSSAEFDKDKLEPEWFETWKNSFAVGKQAEKDGDITNSRGFVWGASMVVRKHAWKSLLQRGYKSKLSDRKANDLTSGGDTEICYALRNKGWKIWYDSGLKFKHFIAGKKLEWNYLMKLFRGFGLASPGLDYYLIKNKEKSASKSLTSVTGSVRNEIHRTLSLLRKNYYRKTVIYDKLSEGDSDIPMIEYCMGRIEGLLKTRKSYNSGLKLLKKTARKNDLKYLKPFSGKGRKSFPRYKIQKKLNGVSVIICTYNGEERLSETIRHVAKQKTDPSLLWELIVVDNASTDRTKQVVKDEWSKYNVNAKLRITDEFTQGLSAARQKGFDTARYDFIVLCDDDNWLDENFVQATYDIMSSNEKIGILGGPNKALCELEEPEWFKWFQQGYASGKQADLSDGKIYEGNITWKRGFVWGAGMIIRRKALMELYSKGFKSIMSDRTGSILSSGGDSEICFALVLSGWQVHYDTRLKLIHCMPAGRLTWNYLIRLFEGFGVTSVGLDYYEKAIKGGRADTNSAEVIKQDWKYEYKKTRKEIRKYGIRKILSLRHSQENDTRIPMLEYYIARLKELKRVKNEYDKNTETIRNAAWRVSNKELKGAHRKFIETENDFRYGWPWQAVIKNKATELKAFPKISILSPSFNSENTIEKAILSVLNQGYPNFEHIIFDGGSTDATVDILKKYPHLIWVSEPDKGQCDAMNKAFDKSTGDIIAYLNVDDYFQRGAFEKIAKKFEEIPDADIVVGNLFFEFDGQTVIRKPETEYRKIMLPFRYIFPINPVSYFYKRHVQTQTGPFPMDNHFTMDYWFLLKAFQKCKVIKTEDYLGTFWMNGLNKTSGADNRKNTHFRVLEHCWQYDRKNLPYYLYNYYKHYYYDEKPYNLKRVWLKTRKNIYRAVSILTFRKNKYYNERLYEKARTSYYSGKRLKATGIMLSSYLIYPKAVKQKSRIILLSYSLLGLENTEKIKWFYFFLTTPPGLPLANKLHYYGNQYKSNSKNIKGSTLLLLTYIISPKFLFKESAKHKPETDKSSGFKLRYLNPLNWIKGIINYFRFKKYKESSFNYYIKAGERYYYHKNAKALFYLILSFLIYPLSVTKKSRQNLFVYSAFGSTITEKLQFLYHLYKDNPEYSFAHKLDYYGNDLRQKGNTFKGNSVQFIAYILSPKYISKRKKIKKSNKVFVSEFQLPKKRVFNKPSDYLNLKNIKSGTGNLLRKSGGYGQSFSDRMKYLPGIVRYRIVSVYHYFRYRKFKAKSKDLYERAQINYKNNNRAETLKLLIPSFFLYPVSVFNRNKWSLMINSVIGNSIMQKLRGK